MLSHSCHVQLFATLWIAACQAPLPIGILQTRIFEWVAMPSSRGSSRPRTGTHVSYVSCIGKWHCTVSLPLALPGSPFDYLDHSKLWTILKVMECKNTFLAWETFMQVKKQWNQTWNKGLIPNLVRNVSKLYTVILLIWLICRVHHKKCWCGWSTTCNQECWEKYQ